MEARSDGGGALHEQSDRSEFPEALRFSFRAFIGQRQRRNREFLFAVQAQGQPAGDKELDVIAALEQASYAWPGVHQMLEIIKKDQCGVRGTQMRAQCSQQVAARGFMHSKRLGNGWQHLTGLTQG